MKRSDIKKVGEAILSWRALMVVLITADIFTGITMPARSRTNEVQDNFDHTYADTSSEVPLNWIDNTGAIALSFPVVINMLRGLYEQDRS